MVNGKKATVKLSPTQSTQKKELNCAGKFDWSNLQVDGADEVTELLAGRWEPSTDDFAAVPGGTVVVTPTFGNFLGAIVQQQDGSISRINLFTHANKGLIAFGGRIDKRSVGHADVFLNTNGPNDNLTAMDPTSMQNLNQPGVTFSVAQPIRGKSNFTVDDVRKKFAADAVIVLYACHSGQDQPFVKSIATFFKVKVIGFSSLIGYFPPAQTQGSSRFQRPGEKIGVGASSAPGAVDWRNLITDSSAIVTTP